MNARIGLKVRSGSLTGTDMRVYVAGKTRRRMEYVVGERFEEMETVCRRCYRDSGILLIVFLDFCCCSVGGGKCLGMDLPVIGPDDAGKVV